MKRHGNLWPQVIDFNNLLAAAQQLECASGSRRYVAVAPTGFRRAGFCQKLKMGDATAGAAWRFVEQQFKELPLRQS